MAAFDIGRLSLAGSTLWARTKHFLVLGASNISREVTVVNARGYGKFERLTLSSPSCASLAGAHDVEERGFMSKQPSRVWD